MKTIFILLNTALVISFIWLILFIIADLVYYLNEREIIYENEN